MNVDILDAGYSVGSHEILKNVQLSLQGAGITVVRGKSSSGKTCLARLICGHIPPTVGVRTFNGKSLERASRSEASAIRASIGYVEQVFSFVEHYSAFDNVLLAGGARRLSKSDATMQTLELFADLGLSHVRTQLVSTMSHWERTLVAIARACIGGTKVVVVDQAFDACDDPSLRTATEALQRLCGNERALVVTTADLQLETLFSSPRVYELRDGSLGDVSKLSSVESQIQNGEML